MKILAEKRQEAREKGDFELADKLRKEIEGKGYKITDTFNGYKLKKVEWTAYQVTVDDVELPTGRMPREYFNQMISEGYANPANWIKEFLWTK